MRQVCYWDCPCCFVRLWLSARRQQLPIHNVSSSNTKAYWGRHILLFWHFTFASLPFSLTRWTPTHTCDPHVFLHDVELTSTMKEWSQISGNVTAILNSCHLFLSRSFYLNTYAETLICSPTQTHQCHFNLQPGQWGLTVVFCSWPTVWCVYVCESPWTVLISMLLCCCALRRWNSPNHNPYSPSARWKDCQASNSSCCLSLPGNHSRFHFPSVTFSSLYCI